MDLGKVLAVVAILCGAPMEDRKQAAYDILLWRARKEDGQLPRSHAVNYFRDLHLVYKPKSGTIPEPGYPSGSDDGISHQEFSAMFEDDSIGFNYLHTLQKMEDHDRVRHHGIKCAASGACPYIRPHSRPCDHVRSIPGCACYASGWTRCSAILSEGFIAGCTGYNIVGPRYHCTNGNFNLCASSYAEMKLPANGTKLEQYIFEEVAMEKAGTKLTKLACYSPASNVQME